MTIGRKMAIQGGVTEMQNRQEKHAAREQDV
jgi:hypothetical protein